MSFTWPLLALHGCLLLLNTCWGFAGCGNGEPRSHGPGCSRRTNLRPLAWAAESLRLFARLAFFFSGRMKRVHMCTNSKLVYFDVVFRLFLFILLKVFVRFFPCRNVCMKFFICVFSLSKRMHMCTNLKILHLAAIFAEGFDSFFFLLETHSHDIVHKSKNTLFRRSF